MSWELRKLLLEAFAEWENRLPNEKPGLNSSIYRFFKEQMQSGIYDFVQSLGYVDGEVKASVGIGQWAAVPWVGIRDSRFTDNFQDGLFVVYVLSPQFNRLYLTIIQGTTHLQANQLILNASKLRKQIEQPEGFVAGIERRLVAFAPLNSKPYMYERAVVYSKRYEVKSLPEETSLRTDLRRALKSYRDYFALQPHSKSNSD